MGQFAESEPEEIRNEAMKIEFEQKLDAMNMDQKMLGFVREGLEHYCQLVADRFNLADQEKINQALLEMIEFHKDQKDRPDGRPYISHPLEVSRIVIEDFDIKDTELIQASLLHDTVEDQGIKLAKPELKFKYSKAIDNDNFEEDHQDEIRALALLKIAKQYDDRVANILDKLSSPDFDKLAKEDTDPQDIEKFQARKHELYKEHIAESIKDPDVLIIKLADFLHNFTDAGRLPESSQKEKFRSKYIPVMPIFKERLLDKSRPLMIPKRDLVIRRLEEANRVLLNKKIGSSEVR